jgi:hypothetical protein
MDLLQDILFGTKPFFFLFIFNKFKIINSGLNTLWKIYHFPVCIFSIKSQRNWFVFPSRMILKFVSEEDEIKHRKSYNQNFRIKKKERKL